MMNQLPREDTSGEIRFGGFWIRVGAYLIDMVILNVVIFFSLSFVPGGSDLLIDNFAAVFLPITILGWLYFAGLHSSKWQASVGKKVLGLKVVDTEFNRISFLRATGRHFAEILSAMIVFIGYLMVGWTKRKQGLHDLIAGTYVAKARQGT
jgi:uncharacterized RDD family membrane protein YckC